MEPEIYWIPGAECGPLAVMPRPRGGDWLEDEVTALREAGVAVLVSLLTPREESELDLAREAELCGALGLTFLSYPIEDRGTPRSARDVARLLERIRTARKAGQGVAIHCRTGIGRSAMVAACVLCAAGCLPGAAFERIAAARRCPVPDTDEQRAWVEAFVKRA